MRNKVLAGLLVAALSVPTLASAHSSCEARQHHRRVVGTVAGAAGGALIGGMLGKGAAAPLLGAAGGAIVGNQVARQKCPSNRAAAYNHRRRHHDDRHYG
jgi:uncharacterized protein YcfJ